MIFNFKEFEKKYNIDTWNANPISKKLRNDVPISKQIQNKIDKYLPNTNTKNNNILSQYLYKLLHYDDFEKQLVEKDIDYISPELLLPIDTITFIIKNISDIKKILMYLIQKNKKTKKQIDKLKKSK